MDFISNRDKQVEEMMKTLNIKSVDELFLAIPESIRLKKVQEDDGLSEYEGIELMRSIASQNRFAEYDSYLGAGAYEHHIPAYVSAITSKSEFLTSYTPYQAEASQGLLQAIFEFQSAISALTGMEVANASLYDGASATAEAALMALRIHKKRKRIALHPSIHPHYLAVVKNYLSGLDVELVKDEVDGKTAALLLQSPNFFGEIESVSEKFAEAHTHGALCILIANPLSYGLFASAGQLQADIAVGDCQPLGIPLQLGGPYAGYLACKRKFIRQMPGRLVGETVDKEGKRGFVLTLQAREQHIRREKASSNICTSQTLAAFASLLTILWYGKEGLKRLALTNYRRTAYLKNQLAEYPFVQLLSKKETFNEFAVHFSCPSEEVQNHFRKAKIEPGVHLGQWYPELVDWFLVAVTETKSLAKLNAYSRCAGELKK